MRPLKGFNKLLQISHKKGKSNSLNLYQKENYSLYLMNHKKMKFYQPIFCTIHELIGKNFSNFIKLYKEG